MRQTSEGCPGVEVGTGVSDGCGASGAQQDGAEERGTPRGTRYRGWGLSWGGVGGIFGPGSLTRARRWLCGEEGGSRQGEEGARGTSSWNLLPCGSCGQCQEGFQVGEVKMGGGSH